MDDVLLKSLWSGNLRIYVRSPIHHALHFGPLSLTCTESHHSAHMWLKCLPSYPNYLSSQHSNLTVHTLWAKADPYLLSCHAQWFFLENSLRVPSWRLLLNNHEILLKTNSVKLERIQAIIPVESLHIRALRLIFNGDKSHIF